MERDTHLSWKIPICRNSFYSDEIDTHMNHEEESLSNGVGGE
jgi:hypothetical protein